MSSEVKLGQHLVASMRGRRYIVALDDVRDTEILARLRSWLPEQNNGSIVLVTTGMAEVTEFDESFFLFEILVVLNEAINWRCIKGLIESRGWVVTAAFEEAGKKIVGNCGGFRIVVAKVMVALLRSEKSLNLWNKLAQIKMIPFSRLMMRYWR
ncbi:toMV resistance protein Tm-2(2)-like [Salvia splendens]|nr:toMV resistance protein Tm-2(2)-like [Salvia splendens]